MMPRDLTDKRDRAFAAHVLDLAGLARQKRLTRFSGFLDLGQLTLAKELLKGEGEVRSCFFGGYPQAERCMLGVFPAYETPDTGVFPITPVTLRWRKQDVLEHRDILGSFMGLGLKRETLGDILVEAGTAVCFLTETAARTVESQLTKVGRHGVQVFFELPQELPARRFEDIFPIVASLRLDCITSALTGLSREKAAGLIRQRLVQQNGSVREDVSCPVKEGDVLSIRGYGKFLFSQIESGTKKGRLRLCCKKYK